MRSRLWKRILKTVLLTYVVVSLVGSLVLSFFPNLDVRLALIERRYGLFLVELSYAEVVSVRSDGYQNGWSHLGDYVAFEDKKVGDRVLNIFIYEPWNTYTDGIWERIEVYSWHSHQHQLLGRSSL